MKGLADASKPRSSPKTKIRDPEPFDGTNQEKLRDFILQCQLVFKGKPEDYKDDHRKVFYAISYLKGLALLHFEPYIMDEKPHPGFMSSWTLFKEELTYHFGSMFPKEEAEQAIEKVRFKENYKAASFFIHFECYKVRTNYNNRTYYHLVKKALPRRIKERLAIVIPKPRTYNELRDLVVQIDQAHWEYKAEEAWDNECDGKSKKNNSSNGNQSNSNNNSQQNNKGKEKPHSNNNRQSSTLTLISKDNNSKNKQGSLSKSSTSQPNDISKYLDKNGHLLPEEKQRRKNEGLCLICAAKGHLAADCPSARKKPNDPSKGRASKMETSTSEPKTEASGSKK